MKLTVVEARSHEVADMLMILDETIADVKAGRVNALAVATHEKLEDGEPVLNARYVGQFFQVVAAVRNLDWEIMRNSG